MAEHIETQLFFDPGDGIYRDHFPGRPVVPGSLIVHGFMEIAARLGHPGQGGRLSRLRFRRFISPGHYCCETLREADALFFKLFDGPTLVASGRWNP